ncbi:hypothetical protein RUA4292_01684 [Ruegeria atlantica]|uniref:Uncharacterized protein n=2 Tax=Ruegeria atlantica TaxID=81569 RepID=A0A0P1EVS0_9RHOB|nr:hypothetical protein RUA4292_01684 [Ruegeria atlantica]
MSSRMVHMPPTELRNWRFNYGFLALTRKLNGGILPWPSNSAIGTESTWSVPQALSRVLAMDASNFNLTATMGLIDPFRAVNCLDSKPYLEWSFGSETGGYCVSSNGVGISIVALSDVEAADTIVASTSWTLERYLTLKTDNALRRWMRSGATLGALEKERYFGRLGGLRWGRHGCSTLGWDSGFSGSFTQTFSGWWDGFDSVNFTDDVTRQLVDRVAVEACEKMLTNPSRQRDARIVDLRKSTTGQR